MAHFAELTEENQVINVVVVNNSELTDANGVEQEQLGIDYLKSIFSESRIWKQTSYNTFKGEHRFGETPFRKNYAEIGGFYDAERDAFIPINHFPSSILNENTCYWEHPKPYPTGSSDTLWKWDEDVQDWVEE